MTNYVHISKGLVINVRISLVNLGCHLNNILDSIPLPSIPLPLATMGRLNRLITVR